MKEYILGSTAIILAIECGIITIKKHTTATQDLIFTATSIQAYIEDETNYSNSGTCLYNCPGSTKEIACKLLAVDERYTHVSAVGDIVLNTSTDNPQNEPIL